MAEHRLEVVPEQAERCPDLGFWEPQTGISRPTDVYLCGQCGIILVREPSGGLAEHRVARCPNCGALNRSSFP